ncbi:hypothetical protein E2C01_073576 [Portunus trituberculatus]|uniref:Uncharacterized protein n=1 Tax=Portunus trituberculatus TaxID=210409 RepID=A0A5B7IEA9_PORTR|nr:hypothetical protein [Portunus trituberculatus]
MWQHLYKVYLGQKMFVFLALQSWMLYPYRMGIQLLQEVNMISQPTTRLLQKWL